MRALWSRAGLNTKLSLPGVGGVLVTAVVLVALAVFQSGRYHDLARREVEHLIEADLDHITEGVYNLVRTEDEAVQQQVADNLNVARHVLSGIGPIGLTSESVSWTAVDQIRGTALEVSLPRMEAGGVWLGRNADARVRTPVVDEVVRLVGGTCTVFQRMNRSGDMLRVATTITDADGRRAIGTFVPAVMPDGRANPVIAAVLDGSTYLGRASAVGSWYLTAYGPLPEGSDDPLGMLYVGVKMESVEARIREAIINTGVGSTGYVYVLGGTGEHRGKYIISQRGERDGEDIWDNVDSDGRYIIREIISTAVGLSPGEMATIRYRWQNPGEREPRWKTARLAYYAPWDWVIGTSVYDDELEAYRNVLLEGRTRMVAVMAMAGLLITVVVGLAFTLLALSIGRPIREMTAVTERIAGGDLGQRLEVPRRDEVGVLARAFNTMTERLRRTMETLRASEAKYRRIFEDSVEGIFQSTFEGRYVTANPALARILGYDSPEELLQSVRDIGSQVYVRSEDRDEILASLRRREPVMSRELRCYRKDGRAIWVSLSARVSQEGSDEPCIDGYLVDIDERRNEEERRHRIEEQLRQAQKMETVGLLAGGVAHDFNNLLTPILGYSDILMDDLAGDDARVGQLREIRNAAERAGELTRRLLAFSRKQLIELAALDLGDVIRRFEVVLRSTIRENVAIRVVLPGSLGSIRGDVGQIEQVLLNLSINARDAMPDGGTLTISAEDVEVGGERSSRAPDMPPGQYVALTVSDTGAGMDEGVQRHLFEPFFTTKPPGEGTGLGLATVYGVVKQHGAFIAVDSATDRGSTFRLYFPRVEGRDAAPAAETADADTPRGTETILVVEDSESARTLVATMLRSLGYTVITASGGDACSTASAAYDGTIHLLLTDVIMPGMNGRDVYLSLRRTRPSLRVLYMSGYTAEMIGHDGVVDEGVHFVQKPFRIRSLAEKVRAALAP